MKNSSCIEKESFQKDLQILNGISKIPVEDCNEKQDLFELFEEKEKIKKDFIFITPKSFIEQKSKQLLDKSNSLFE